MRTTQIGPDLRLRKEYLANLREFHKCKSGKREREVEVGDVVVVCEEERKRGECRETSDWQRSRS